MSATMPKKTMTHPNRSQNQSADLEYLRDFFTSLATGKREPATPTKLSISTSTLLSSIPGSGNGFARRRWPISPISPLANSSASDSFPRLAGPATPTKLSIPTTPSSSSTPASGKGNARQRLPISPISPLSHGSASDSSCFPELSMSPTTTTSEKSFFDMSDSESESEMEDLPPRGRTMRRQYNRGRPSTGRFRGPLVPGQTKATMLPDTQRDKVSESDGKKVVVVSEDEDRKEDKSENDENKFTFKLMIHELYEIVEFAEMVQDVIEDSKEKYKPLPPGVISRRRKGEKRGRAMEDSDDSTDEEVDDNIDDNEGGDDTIEEVEGETTIDGLKKLHKFPGVGLGLSAAVRAERATKKRCVGRTRSGRVPQPMETGCMYELNTDTEGIAETSMQAEDPEPPKNPNPAEDLNPSENPNPKESVDESYSLVSETPKPAELNKEDKIPVTPLTPASTPRKVAPPPPIITPKRLTARRMSNDSVPPPRTPFATSYRQREPTGMRLSSPWMPRRVS
ncbi:hypothetical protein K474DRAFT_1699149 [Panus rudis PR-1116 ss-1]|nr:hypothetical protein K474DRAFT_1699149 [Panus rudis PR-1116 ss-1]